MIDVWISQYLLKDERIKCFISVLLQTFNKSCLMCLLEAFTSCGWWNNGLCLWCILLWHCFALIQMWLSHLAVCSADYKYCSQKQLCFSFLFFVCYFFFVFSSVSEICVCLRLNCMVNVVITIYRLLFPTKIGVCVCVGRGMVLAFLLCI